MTIFAESKWIGREDLSLIDWRRPTVPAPVFRRDYQSSGREKRAVASLTGLGFFEFRLNGRKVGHDVLVPAVTNYDRRWRYKRYDVTGLLRPGRNRFEVTVGNGLYNCQTPEVWHFDKADWRDYPKMIFELCDGDDILLVSDSSWLVKPGPVIFDSLRGGEIYDARLEIPDDGEMEAAPLPGEQSSLGRWLPSGEDAGRQWRHALVVPGPGGIGEEETMPPCQICAAAPMKALDHAPRIYDAGGNLAGWPAITVRGQRGAKITLRCGERLNAEGTALDNHTIDQLLLDDSFQRDVYILRGGDLEKWEPRFTYHGFRYLETEIEGEAEILAIEAKTVHTDFTCHGSLETSDPAVNRLLAKGERSLLGNLIGIPTDCPTREKNGWTSEAQLVYEFAMYRFDAGSFFGAFTDILGDVQRPDGQLPGIAPSAGWGYNWGNGPAWDSALFTFAYQLWLFTGSSEVMERHFERMAKYLDFAGRMCENGILRYGLGDWLAPEATVKPEFVSTAFLYDCFRTFRRCAEVLGRTAYFESCDRQSATIRAAFNRHFYLGDGRYDGGNSTSLALPLYYQLADEAERPRIIENLRELIRSRHGRVDYGTIGSKAVPRALLENGLADEAWLLLTQRDYPGYQVWDRLSPCDTFPEAWDAVEGSLNHGAFTDILACLYRYFAGFRHAEAEPGPDFLAIAPQFPAGLDRLSAEYLGYRIDWLNQAGSRAVTVRIPAGKQAQVILPGSPPSRLGAGEYRLQI